MEILNENFTYNLQIEKKKKPTLKSTTLTTHMLQANEWYTRSYWILKVTKFKQNKRRCWRASHWTSKRREV